MTGRIFITGDKHGSFFPLFGLAEKNELKDSDILIIAGDAGYVWDENYHHSVETLQQIFPGTVAFIDGNHENHPLLNRLEIRQWNGGSVHQVGDRVYHLMRGEIYSIYGNSIFTFGGARSVDIDRREEGTSWWKEEGSSWWKEEEPSPEEIEYGKRQFMEHIGEIRYVITHETPLSARASISRSKPIDRDYHLPALFDDWYKMLLNSPKFKKWYFGHMHVDQIITPQLRAIHNNILPIGEETKMRWA